MNQSFDDNQCYTLNLWVVSDKTIDEFEGSLADVICPLTIHDHKFELGEVSCEIFWDLDLQPPPFAGVPRPIYSFRIDVDVVDYNLWAKMDRVFVFALSSALRSKFSCEYLITADLNFFTFFSGTNKKGS